MTPRPLWRWWLFCAALWLCWRTGWRWQWLADVYQWAVLPAWLGEGADLSGGTGQPPW